MILKVFNKNDFEMYVGMSKTHAGEKGLDGTARGLTALMSFCV